MLPLSTPLYVSLGPHSNFAGFGLTMEVMGYRQRNPAELFSHLKIQADIETIRLTLQF